MQSNRDVTPLGRCSSSHNYLYIVTFFPTRGHLFCEMPILSIMYLCLRTCMILYVCCQSLEHPEEPGRLRMPMQPQQLRLESLRPAFDKVTS